jgi:hypothetical protein
MMQMTSKRANRWLNAALARIERLADAGDKDAMCLRDPGYTMEVFNKPARGEYDEDVMFVVFAGWEDVRAFSRVIGPRFDRRASETDDCPNLDNRIQSGFSDEYTSCGDCCACIRTSPDSYCWQPDFVVGDGWISCRDCVENAPQSAIDEYKNTTRAIPDWIDLDGWVQIEPSYQTGMHAGMTDDPSGESAKLEAAGIDWLITAQPSQFYADWSIWVEEENEAATYAALGVQQAA